MAWTVTQVRRRSRENGLALPRLTEAAATTAGTPVYSCQLPVEDGWRTWSGLRELHAESGWWPFVAGDRGQLAPWDGIGPRPDRAAVDRGRHLDPADLLAARATAATGRRSAGPRATEPEAAGTGAAGTGAAGTGAAGTGAAGAGAAGTGGAGAGAADARAKFDRQVTSLATEVAAAVNLDQATEAVPFPLRSGTGLVTFCVTPARHGYEVPALLDWSGAHAYGLGGAEHYAILRHLHRHYGAELVTLAGKTTMSLLVGRRPRTPLAAARAAVELAAYCPDVVEPQPGGLLGLVRTQLLASSWVLFWSAA